MSIEPQPRVRPTSITVIGWLFIGFGALALLSGIFGTIMSSFIPPLDEPPAKMFDAPLPFQLMSRLFDYFAVLSILQALLGIAMMWSGTGFLRLQPWSRKALETITWLALTYLVVFGAFWIWAVAAMWSEERPGTPEATVFFPLFMSFGAAMIVGFSIPPVVIIRVLRGETVRAALGGRRAAPELTNG